MIILAHFSLLIGLNMTDFTTINHNRSDCPIINGTVRCDLKEKNCRYSNGSYICEKKS